MCWFQDKVELIVRPKKLKFVIFFNIISIKETDHAGNFMSLKCVVYNANYRSWHQSYKIKVIP